MRVAIDVDGVLADQVPGLLQRIEQRYGVKWSIEDITAYNIPVTEDVHIGMIAVDALHNDPSYALSMPLIPGALEGMRQLIAKHYTIIVTDRPPESDVESVVWLDKMQVPYHEYINTHDVGKWTLDVAALVDDYHQNIQWFERTGRLAILFTRPWNRDFFNLGVRAHNWEEVVRIINESTSI